MINNIYELLTASLIIFILFFVFISIFKDLKSSSFTEEEEDLDFLETRGRYRKYEDLKDVDELEHFFEIKNKKRRM